VSDQDDQAEYRQYRFALPPGATDILLIRHGESQPIRPGVEVPMLDGQSDPPLDPRGEHEAERVAERLAGQHLDAIYVSPLRRTQQTAAPLAQRLGLEPIVEPDIREVFLGEWEGPAFRIHVSEASPIAQQMFEEERWDVIPGAEPSEALAERLRKGLTRIAEAHRDRRVAVFAHGGVIGAICALATSSRPFAFVAADNASITHLVVTDDRWILRRFNDTGHLGTDLDRAPEPLN
jgi:probable phosphoglycerate mutase